MSTRASIKGHPVHSMMVGLPIGLFVFSFFCDVVSMFGGSDAWATVALYTLAGAVATALLAAVPGLVDYAGLTQLRARHTARTHGLLNLAAVGLGDLGPSELPALELRSAEKCFGI